MNASWRTISILILLGTLHSVLGEDSQATFAQATELLERGDTQAAIETYESLLENGRRAPEIYRNLAIAYDRDGQKARAVAESYRAWLSAPSSSAAEDSFLALASEAEISKKRLRDVQNSVYATRWAGPLAILASVLLWTAVICLVFWRRHTSLIATGVTVLVLGGIAAAASGYCHWKRPHRHAAWVVGESSAQLLASHVEGAPEIGSIRVYDEVYIQASRDDWKHVATGNARSGWVADQRIVPLFPWQS